MKKINIHPVTKRLIMSFFLLFVVISFSKTGVDNSRSLFDKYPVDATLLNAYKTIEYYGSGSSTKGIEVFKAKLKIDNYNYYVNRDIDIFFYNKFKENGDKPLAATVEISKIQLGEKPPIIFIISKILYPISILAFIVLSIFTLIMFKDWKKAYDKKN